MWPNGKKQLTEVGIAQHRELGLFLRDRYRDLFPFDQYRRKDIYVRSTDKDRTLLSAMSNLGAFFNESQPGYVPVPIHTVPSELDTLLRFYKLCKRYIDVKAELTKTPKLDELNEKYASDLAKLTRLVGLEEKLRIETSSKVIDAVECHIANGKRNSLPEEIDDNFVEILEQIRNYQILTKFTDLELERRVELSRMLGGKLLGDILSSLKSPMKQEGFNVGIKYLVYSAHDTTMASILVAMNATLSHFENPHYASGFF